MVVTFIAIIVKIKIFKYCSIIHHIYSLKKILKSDSICHHAKGLEKIYEKGSKCHNGKD